MRGHEHYAEAERLLAACPGLADPDAWTQAHALNVFAAQAHATLAAAAATALATAAEHGNSSTDSRLAITAYRDTVSDPHDSSDDELADRYHREGDHA